MSIENIIYPFRIIYQFLCQFMSPPVAIFIMIYILSMPLRELYMYLKNYFQEKKRKNQITYNDYYLYKETESSYQSQEETRGIGKWIVIAVVVFLLIVSMGYSDKEAGNNDTGNYSGLVDNNSNTNDVNSDSVAGTNNDKDYIISAGNVFEANGLKITINEINANYTDYDDPYNMRSPKEGYKYISVSFTYENTSKSDSYVSIYDYDCYADGSLCKQSYYFDTDLSFKFIFRQKGFFHSILRSSYKCRES